MIRRLGFEEAPAPYEAEPQRVRFWTEAWAEKNLYCPACGAERLFKAVNNSPAKDFTCSACGEDFELKSSRGRMPPKIVDGAYDTLLGRLKSGNNPNLALLRYDRAALSVADLEIVPKHFFTPQLVEKRAPLGPSARRAGWVGCNIRISDLPPGGRIALVKNGVIVDREQVLSAWAKTAFLQEVGPEKRGWLIEVWACISRLGKPEFELSDLYAFEGALQAKYPGNANIRPKIRQQLQVLRDVGRVQFLGGGRYRVL